MAPSGRSPEADRAIVLAIMRYAPNLIRWARRCGVSADDAPDVAQEVALRAWRKWETSETPPEQRAPWLFTITARAAARYLRTHATRPLELRDPGETEDAPDDAPLPGAALEARDLLRALEGATAPEGWRTLVALAAGQSAEEIAAADGVPLGTVYTRSRRARLDVAAALARIAAADAGPMMPRKPLPPRRRRRAPKGER